MLNISEFMVVRLIFFANFDVKYAGRAHPVIQLNTKTASRDYRLLLGWEPGQAFLKMTEKCGEIQGSS